MGLLDALVGNASKVDNGGPDGPRSFRSLRPCMRFQTVGRRLVVCLVLLASPGFAGQAATSVDSIPEQFHGAWHSGNPAQCEIQPLEVNAHWVGDFGGFEFKGGTLDGDTLTFTSVRCEEGECGSNMEEVSLSLDGNRLRYSHSTDENGDPLALERCPQ